MGLGLGLGDLALGQVILWLVIGNLGNLTVVHWLIIDIHLKELHIHLRFLHIRPRELRLHRRALLHRPHGFSLRPHPLELILILFLLRRGPQQIIKLLPLLFLPLRPHTPRIPKPTLRLPKRIPKHLINIHLLQFRAPPMVVSRLPLIRVFVLFHIRRVGFGG